MYVGVGVVERGTQKEGQQLVILVCLIIVLTIHFEWCTDTCTRLGLPFSRAGPYPHLRHKIKMAAIVGDFVYTGYEGAYGKVSITIRNPKTFQVRHIYNHPILIRQE